MKGYWFKAKQYGFGLYPSSWQGWIIILIYLLLLVEFFEIIDRYSHSASDTLIGVFIPFILLTAWLLFTAYGTGEKPRWRWGK